MWLSSEEALRRLNVKPQTLYASVSRGRIKAKADPADPRRSLYSREDVERLARRATGRPRMEAVAVEAINWGEPVLTSAISTIAQGRLWYRGQDAADLSAAATLEDIATLLWGGFSPADAAPSTAEGDVGFRAAMVALAERAAIDPPSVLRGPAALRDDASSVLGTISGALTSAGLSLLHERLAAWFQRPEAAEDLRAALVLLADHELNASTFAVRVTISTGASLAAGALSGFAALSGPLHGRASRGVSALIDDIAAADEGPIEALRHWLGEGRTVPGFGHRLYPNGDVRARTLLDRLPLPKRYADLMEAAETLLGEAPNVDFALAALAAAYNLPETAPIEVFALARSVGWLAHMLEQVETGSLIRPRARYVGVRPPVT